MQRYFLVTWLAGGMFLAAVGEAGLICEEPVFDYGTVSASDQVGHSYLLKNTGTNAVRIIKVRKTCGCVATVASKKDVEPGGTAEIRVSVSLKGRSGSQSKTVYVHTNSPETPLLKLVAKGKVRRAVPGSVQTPTHKPAVPSRPVVVPAAVSPENPMAPGAIKGLYAVPHEIRLPRTVEPGGVTVRIEIKPADAPSFRLKGILPPADISFAVRRSNSECWIELGPIQNVQALKGSALVIITTSGVLRITCTIEE